MANEILYSDLVTNGGAVAEVLSALVVEALHDPADLSSLATRVDFDAIGSSTMAVTIDQAPSAFSGPLGEATATSNSAYVTSEFQLAVAKYSLAYELTDLVGIAGGPISLESIVRKLERGVGLTLTDMITALFPSLSNNVGTTTAPMTVTDLYSAQFQLNSSNAQGPFSAVLSPTQMNNLRSGLRTEVGAAQFQEPQADMMATKGAIGFQGSWNGINFYQSDSCVLANANADRVGAMFDSGCWAYTMANVGRMQGHIPSQNVLVNAGDLIVEMIRDGYGGQTAALATIYAAVAEVEDARGVSITTVA